mgnify:CR=1 FL=1
MQAVLKKLLNYIHLATCDSIHYISIVDQIIARCKYEEFAKLTLPQLNESKEDSKILNEAKRIIRVAISKSF